MDRIGIEEWLEKYKVKNYSINEDLGISVGGDYFCASNKLVETEVFLYDCSVNQIKLYYKNKSLNEVLHTIVSKGVAIKNKKI